MKPCGHVVCKTCTDKLVKPGKQCIHCDVKLSEKEIIQLTREGPSRCQVMISTALPPAQELDMLPEA